MTTELDVINFALSMSGEAPLNDADEGHPDVATIKRNIERERTRLLMIRDWWWATDPCVKLKRDANSGVIYIPQNAIKCIPHCNGYSERITERDRRLWDSVNNTFVLKRDYDCTIVYDLPFNELPEAAKLVVELAVGKSYQQNFDADSQRAQQITYDYTQYLDLLKADDIRHKQVNFLRSPSTFNRLYDINGGSWRGRNY